MKWQVELDDGPQLLEQTNPPPSRSREQWQRTMAWK